MIDSAGHICFCPYTVSTNEFFQSTDYFAPESYLQSSKMVRSLAFCHFFVSFNFLEDFLQFKWMRIAFWVLDTQKGYKWWFFISWICHSRILKNRYNRQPQTFGLLVSFCSSCLSGFPLSTRSDIAKYSTMLCSQMDVHNTSFSLQPRIRYSHSCLCVM